MAPTQNDRSSCRSDVEPARGHGDGLCVLTFHRIVDIPRKDHDLSWRDFRSCLDTIARTRREVTTNLDPSRTTAGEVVLTFDDGTEDHLQVGIELDRHGMGGIFFIPAGKIGLPGYLAPDGVQRLRTLGHDVGSHAWTHQSLDALSRVDLAYELQASRDRLSALAGRPVAYFAPPGGSSHPQLAAELEAAGYATSRSMRWGLHVRLQDKWFAPCVPVTSATIRLGWVEHVLTRWQLPLPMRAAWYAKNRIPPGARSKVRALVHINYSRR